MIYITYFIKFFYRIRYWLIIFPVFITLFAIWYTQKMPKNYTVNSSIYTGIITGVNVMSETGATTTSYTQGSMMDNLLNLLTADQTLKQVSLRLYARCMVYGDPEKDNIYINADHYRQLYEHGEPIHHLIDKSSSNDSINEQRTYENLVAYETNDPSNYVYGIYQYQLPYVNRESLQKIIAFRISNSDVLELSYTTDDPGITYQTLCILIDEFIHQYQELRFGATNSVIAFFEAELQRIGKELKAAEDDLTVYRTDNRVINYDEETKHVAALNRDFELQYWESKNAFEVADSIRKDLEKRMGIYSDIIRNNKDYIYHNEKITRLSEQLAMATYYPEGKITARVKDSLAGELAASQKAIEQTIRDFEGLRYTKEGIANDAVVEEWLKQEIAYKKGEAELHVLQERARQMSGKYTHFAPIGSVLNRKERVVNIFEKEYFSTMDALNSARLRQKSLQMTSATLKVMNDPYYPLTSLSNHRKKIIIGVFFASLVFTIFFFLLIELMDHTLHHKFKAELLTGKQVIGAFCRTLRIQSRRFNQLYTTLSAQTLCNYATTYFKPSQNNIINLISNEPGEGKSFVSNQMAEQFKAQGLEVKQLSWHDNFRTDSDSFTPIPGTQDQDPNGKADLKNQVILVEYPSLKEAALTTDILQGASVNLEIVDSRRTWKNTDQLLFNRTKEMAGKTPLFLVLNYTKRDAAEDLNGLMPPYTFFRKLFYRLSQLGLTATDRHKKYV